ncbi:histidine phosphatase superfamily [Elsinoe ampelina]|uniref:Phytase A n=1 Tax=Elsinoe ampelina TaxID=302913 RepID=A0A6A6GDI0_9PEZI|nr:histidine phosphatase superfamily [Elsinoe ampelina]
MALVLLAVAGFAVKGYAAPAAASCDSVDKGYQCSTDISHNWGQYSPWFSVPSTISTALPSGCEYRTVQVLSRHGARDPTASKTKTYNATITKLQAAVDTFTGKYAFLNDYVYNLGADQLTLFGEQQMINSGIHFYNRYASLARKDTPFIRASGEDRVVESALNWTQGFHTAKSKTESDSSYPYPLLTISEAPGQANPLNHDLCTAFESGPYSTIASDAQSKWASIFVPPIQSRLNSDLATNLTTTDIITLMDLCPFTTVASPTGVPSPFCTLFTPSEFASYAHYESLNKYYGYGAGNPLGPTQGVGFANELIARLTERPVQDDTSTNKTLDADGRTFPLGRKVYADFSHDNDMTAVMFALGLFEGLAPLATSGVDTLGEGARYSAANTVPFGARVYVELMRCKEEKTRREAGGEGAKGLWKRKDAELVRVLVNDRVMPLQNCGADKLGRCELGKWVESLKFARTGGRWGECGINGTAV